MTEQDQESQVPIEPLEIGLNEGNPLLGVNSFPDITLCNLVQKEIHSPLFSLTESNGKIIDVQESFIPQPLWLTGLFRAFSALFSFMIILYSVIISWADGWLWFGYLTHWCAILTILYQSIMFLCCINPSLLLQPEPKEEPAFLLRFVWLIYSVATTLEITITLLYWELDHQSDEPIEFANVALHGIFGIVLAIDGGIIAKVPVRIKHLFFVELVSILYLIWSLIHTFVFDGKPLYNALNWRDNTVFAASATVISMVFVVPFFFMIVWMLSHCSCGINNCTILHNQ